MKFARQAKLEELAQHFEVALVKMRRVHKQPVFTSAPRQPSPLRPTKSATASETRFLNGAGGPSDSSILRLSCGTFRRRF